MKPITRISLLIIFVCLFTTSGLAQKRRNTSAMKATVDKVYCEGDRVPTGFVVVGQKPSSRCGGKLELAIKRPADSETICDGSPIPEGYIVTSQTGSGECSSQNRNPLTNALVISRQASATQSTRGTEARSTRNAGDDEEEGTSVRITVINGKQPEKPKSVLEQRAEDAQRKARLKLAVLDNRIMVGMTREQVLESWGRPDRIQKSTTPTSRSETWWYHPNGHTVWIDFSEDVVSDYRADY